MSFTYRVEQLADEPIVIDWIGAAYAMAEHSEPNSDAIRAILEAAEQPLFFIFELSEANFSLDDIMAGASRGAHSTQGLLRHPKMRQMVVVTQSRLLKLAAIGMKSVTFGRLNVKVCSSLDEALTYCRAEVAAQAKA
ncbi:MAG: hypothetical protein OHK0023_25350 [Anaerolineae bacterium]